MLMLMLMLVEGDHRESEHYRIMCKRKYRECNVRGVHILDAKNNQYGTDGR